MQCEARGLAAVNAKASWWIETYEIPAAEVTGPWPRDDRFIQGFKYGVINGPMGQRMLIDKMALYQVANGKIVCEEFFCLIGG